MSTETKEKPIKKKINKDEMIECKNITNGTLVYASRKTGAEYHLEGFGAVEWFSVDELITMKSSMGKILTEPWLAIMDDDVIDYLGLRHVYDKIIVPIDNLGVIFNKSVKELTKILDIAPNGIKTLIASKAKEMVENNQLDSIAKIKLIEEKLGIELIEKK